MKIIRVVVAAQFMDQLFLMQEGRGSNSVIGKLLLHLFVYSQLDWKDENK